MTYKELQDEVLAHGFRESYRTRVKTWLNQGQSEVYRLLDIIDVRTQGSITTIIGTSVYSTPPVSNATIEGVIDEALGFSLEFRTYEDLLAKNALGTFTGRPIEYAIAGSQGVILSPVPDAVYTLTVVYFTRPVNMSADGDQSTLPDDLDHAMISWALSRAFRAEDDAQMSQFYMSEFQRDVINYGEWAGQKSKDPTQVSGTWGM